MRTSDKATNTCFGGSCLRQCCIDLGKPLLNGVFVLGLMKLRVAIYYTLWRGNGMVVGYIYI